MKKCIVEMWDEYKLDEEKIIIKRFENTYILPLKLLKNEKEAKGTCLYTIQTGRGKTTQYIHVIHNKTQAHSQIKYTVTSDKVTILKSTIVLSQNLTVWTVAYEAINKYLVTPNQ